MIAKRKATYRAPRDVAGYSPQRDSDGYVFDAEAASRITGFFPDCLTHVKGATGAFELEKWQRNILATLFGWRRKKDGARRYREALIAVPRKNGKTAMCAGLGLYCLRCDGERGPEVYCAAHTREQATLVFDPAAQMVRNNATMLDELDIHDSTKRIIRRGTSDFLRAIPSDAASSHGYNASAVIFDELHTQETRDLYDVLRTSQGARRQPLFISITTAGHKQHSICWEVWEYARKVRDGVIRDPRFLPVIYELREGEDWHSEKVWKRVNPNLGVSVGLDFLREEHQRAVEVTAYENTFRNLYLNEWTEQAVRWLPMDRWRECGGTLPDLRGRDAWLGVDLSNKHDITAVVAAIPVAELVQLICRFYVPSESARVRERRDRVPYGEWARAGWITEIPGDVIDYAYIRRDIDALAAEYHVVQIAIDAWNAAETAQRLQDDHGYDVKTFPQNMSNFTGPSKELERLVRGRLLRHGGNPVLEWMASNVVVYPDCNENIRPDKSRSAERIDGIVAAIMALGSLALTPSTASGCMFVC